MPLPTRVRWMLSAKFCWEFFVICQSKFYFLYERIKQALWACAFKLITKPLQFLMFFFIKRNCLAFFLPTTFLQENYMAGARQKNRCAWTSGKKQIIICLGVTRKLVYGHKPSSIMPWINIFIYFLFYFV